MVSCSPLMYIAPPSPYATLFLNMPLVILQLSPSMNNAPPLPLAVLFSKVTSLKVPSSPTRCIAPPLPEPLAFTNVTFNIITLELMVNILARFDPSILCPLPIITSAFDIVIPPAKSESVSLLNL